MRCGPDSRAADNKAAPHESVITVDAAAPPAAAAAAAAAMMLTNYYRPTCNELSPNRESL